MNQETHKESTKYWRAPELGNLELLHARYHRHSFDRHFHEGYAVGVIENGALGFRYLGRDQVAEAGAINLAVPGEVHNGFPAGPGGWRYRMFYLPLEVMARIAAEAGDGSDRAPFFTQGVLNDPWLAGRLRALHLLLEDPGGSSLERESAFLWTMAQLIVRHADRPPAVSRKSPPQTAAAKARDYIHARYEDNISLERLSRAVGLSRFHLVRVFREQYGLPPHAYQNLVRLHQARALLGRGRSIAEAAAETGFFDQSHLTRRFKAAYGVTPGAFSNSIQDAS